MLRTVYISKTMDRFLITTRLISVDKTRWSPVFVGTRDEAKSFVKGYNLALYNTTPEGTMLEVDVE